MRSRPEAIAWIVILGSFVVFCLVITGLLLGAYWYWNNAAQPRWARLTVIEGAVAIRERERPDPVVGHTDQLLHEGDTISTNASARAFLTLFDGSTVTIYPGSELTLASLRSRRFRSQNILIALQENVGKTTVAVAPANGRQVSFEMLLQGARGVLVEGFYTVEASPEIVRLKVREVGAASVSLGSQSVQLAERQFVESSGGRLGMPRALGEELVANGEFDKELSGWQQGVRELVPDVRGKVEWLGGANEGNAARFLRRGTRGSWAETYLHQDINRDLSDALSLRLSLNLKLALQDVQGGGERGSEYPMLVRIDYLTVGGRDAYWVRGFYYTNTRNNPTTNGVKLPHDEWVTYVEPQNILSLDPKPKQIRSIELIASGHDYESLVGRVSLVAE